MPFTKIDVYLKFQSTWLVASSNLAFYIGSGWIILPHKHQIFEIDRAIIESS